MARAKVLIVGAGFAGFHCARELERLRPDEAEFAQEEIAAGYTRHLPSGEQMTSYDAAQRYAADDVPLLVIVRTPLSGRVTAACLR